MNKKYFFGALALGASFLLQSTVVLAADRYVQTNVLHADNGSCTGAVKGGKVQVKEQSNGDIKYVVTLSSAAPAGTYSAFWTCTTVARGCHANACGFITAGTIVKSGTGSTTSTFTLPGGNPFPGNYVHADIIGPASYTATFAGIPATGPLSTSVKLPAIQAGDPSQ